MIHRLQFINRADLQDTIMAIVLAHAETMRLVSMSPESNAFSEGYYKGLTALCVALNLSKPSVPCLERKP